MKSLILLTLFFWVHCCVPSTVSATVFSKNQRYATSVKTKKKAYKERVFVKFLQLKSKFSPDKKMAKLTLIEAIALGLAGLILLNYSRGSNASSSQTGIYGPTVAEIFAFIFSVFFLILSVVLFIVALVMALY